MIRAMALGEVNFGAIGASDGREIQAGLALGAILGAIGVLRVGAWAIIGDIFASTTVRSALAARRHDVGIALVGVVIWGNAFRFPCFPFFCAESEPIRRHRLRRSSQRWSM